MRAEGTFEVTSELAIYFAAAVRGGASYAQLAARIDALAQLGHVLTEHMASAHTIDIGDDAAIHAHDQALLARAHVFIADVTQPSTGTGYMAARAIALGIPVLCLCATGTRASAMIAGSPEITTQFYADEADFMSHVRAFLLAHAKRIPATRARRIFLAGPPGSGKGTAGARLAALTGAPHISTGELLRELVRARPAEPRTRQIDAWMTAGQLVPAAVMRDLVRERLAAADCRLFGVILDGYPPSREDLANLAELPPDLVIYFDCSDATAISRQVARNARATDTVEKATERLRAFHAAHGDFAEWYPASVVVRVDAEQTPAAVLAVLVELLRPPPRGRSYDPLPGVAPRSTRVHFHVDAVDDRTVRAIASSIAIRHKPAQGQLKIYPIQALALASQQRTLPVYKQLPNFHPIEDAEHEAFITGRLGDGDRSLMQAALEVTSEHGGMAELEEYVGEWTLRQDGSVVVDATYELLAIDHTYPDFAGHRCTEIPDWELHHGFDVAKRDAGPPIALVDLIAACARAGLDNGGWFIFANDAHWAYRSNEFANGTETVARERLFAQARALRGVLVERGLRCDIGYSLERVHSIWVW